MSHFNPIDNYPDGIRFDDPTAPWNHDDLAEDEREALEAEEERRLWEEEDAMIRDRLEGR